MGLLNKAMANANKEEDRGEGLLSRAGRYARKPRGAEPAVSPEGGEQTPQPEDVEMEMESVPGEPPPRPERGGGRERKGLLGRALAVSDEQPVSRRQSRRERRRAEKAASEAHAARAPVSAEEVVPETPAAQPAVEREIETVSEEIAAEAPVIDMEFDEAASIDTPIEETAPAEEPSVEDFSFEEEVFDGQVMPETTAREEGGAAAEELPAGLPDESPVELTSEFPAELDFGDKAGAAPEADSAAAAKLDVKPDVKHDAKPGGKRKGGLLAIASRIAEKEGTGERAAGRAGPSARQAARKAVPGEAGAGTAKKAPRASVKAQAAEGKRSSRAPKGQVSKTAEREPQPEAAVPETAFFAAGEETARPETAEARDAALPVELKNFVLTLESHLSKGDALRALELFNASVAREGHTSFILRVLETMTRLGKGKSALLFVPSKERFSVELRVPPLDKQTKLRNASFRQDSRFIQALKECGRGFFKPTGRKGDTLKKEASALGSLSPWVSVPLPVGNELVAFVVIGKQPEKPKADEGSVELLARLAAPYVNKYLLLKEHRLALSSLEKELKERDSLYSLYSAFESPRDKLPLPERCVKELLDGIAANLGIGSAVVLADWKPKTAAGSSAQGGESFVPVASIGVPEKALARFRIPAKDREIRSIVESGRPSVPKDASKRKETLSRYVSSKTGGGSGDASAASRWPRSYVATPLLFNGDTLGLFVVHEMKGLKKTLSQETAERLRHASRVLVPALLYGKLHSMSPFDTMRGLISSQIDEAKRNNVSLAVAVFTVENAKKACGELGFGVYWGVVERLRKLIESAAGEKGVVKDVDWNSLSLFFREHVENEVDDVIARVRTGFTGGLRKNERESGISLATLMTRFPKDSKSVEDILLSVT